MAQQHPGHPKKGTAERQEPRTRFGALCWRKGEVNTEKRQRFLPTAGNGTNLWIKRRVAGVNLFALCTRTLRPTFEEKKNRERATFSQKERDRSHSLQTTLGSLSMLLLRTKSLLLHWAQPLMKFKPFPAQNQATNPCDALRGMPLAAFLPLPAAFSQLLLAGFPP